MKIYDERVQNKSHCMNRNDLFPWILKESESKEKSYFELTFVIAWENIGKIFQYVMWTQYSIKSMPEKLVAI